MNQEWEKVALLWPTSTGALYDNAGASQRAYAQLLASEAARTPVSVPRLSLYSRAKRALRRIVSRLGAE